MLPIHNRWLVESWQLKYWRQKMVSFLRGSADTNKPFVCAAGCPAEGRSWTILERSIQNATKLRVIAPPMLPKPAEMAPNIGYASQWGFTPVTDKIPVPKRLASAAQTTGTINLRRSEKENGYAATNPTTTGIVNVTNSPMAPGTRCSDVSR